MRPEDITLQPVALRQASAPLADIEAKVAAELETLRPGIKSGMRVALAAGSRGVNNLARIVGKTAAVLKDWGALPFIVPAMGSHGGATAEGQAEVLAGYGITEETMGVPVLSSMEAVRVGTAALPEDVPVFMDKNAHGADGIIAINRVKPHTDFHATHESGVVKMLVIGLGKQAQAVAVHRYGTRGLANFILPAARTVLATGKIIGALAILEDGYDATSDITCARADGIEALDTAFLARSRQMMAKLPFQALDVLIVDEMGKDISGTGMDTNVIGRVCIRGAADGPPHCGRIAVLNLTQNSHGNAVGIGLADIATRRLLDKIDWPATNQNVVTSGFLERGFRPVEAETDRGAVALALATCAAPNPAAPRVARIQNTLRLDKVYISPALAGPELKPLAPPAPMAFAEGGTLFPFD